MPEGQVLEFERLSKRFGSVAAVDGFSARVEPGTVTGFLGPNGAGKTTTLRMLLGLVRPSHGRVTIGGRPYAALARPLHTVGAVLEASSFHPGRTAANHLKVYAQAASLPVSRVDEALATVGLADVAGRRIGGYSLGMRQRLGLAGALLGDPGVLVLDEPANGLDPEGITWMRGLLRDLARQGRTVLVSSHLLAEVAQTVDRLLIISRGRLVFQGGLDELADPSEYTTVVDAADRGALTAALDAAGIRAQVLRSGLVVQGTEPAAVGQAAAAAGVALSLLQRRGPALEEVFFDLVNGLRVHPSAQAAAGGDGRAAEPVVPAVPVDASAPAVPVDAPAEAVPVDAPAEAVPERSGPAAVGDEPGGASEDAAETRADDVPDDADDAATSLDATTAEEHPDDAEAAMATAVAANLEATAGGTPGAAFAVATTGMIDIVAPATADDPDAEGRTDTVDGADGDTDADADVQHPDDEAAEAADSDEEETVAGEPDRLPDEDPPTPQTEADVAADAFFRAYDRPDDQPDEPGSEPGAQPDEPGEPDEPGTEASGDADRDGGDQR